MNGSVKLVIAGLGLVGKRHAEAIHNVENVELVAIVDPDNFAADYSRKNNLKWYPSLSEMFAAQDPDGVILATPTPQHVEQGLQCVARACPVLVEKPLATFANEAKALVDAATQANIPLLVGHHRRHNPLIQKAREQIKAGQIGKIRAVHVNCWFYKPDHYFDIAPWRKLKGAGPISVNLVHDVDLMRHLCGEIASVQAQAQPSQRGFENEDVAAALLRFDNGAIGTITVSDSIVSPWSWEMTSREYPIYPSTSQSCYLLGGSHGSLSIPDMTLWSHNGRRDWWQPISAIAYPCTASDPLINQISHFAEVISGKEEPLVSGTEGLKTLQVIEAIQKAASTGKIVLLNDRGDLVRSESPAAAAPSATAFSMNGKGL